MDRALPFGLCSAPKIFSAVADLVIWVLHCNGIAHKLHYLDDFLFLGAPYTEEAAKALETASQVLHMLGIPIAVHKTEGPATSLVFLGIVIDTALLEFRLPAEKLSRLQNLDHSVKDGSWNHSWAIFLMPLQPYGAPAGTKNASASGLITWPLLMSSGAAPFSCT